MTDGAFVIGNGDIGLEAAAPAVDDLVSDGRVRVHAGRGEAVFEDFDVKSSAAIEWFRLGSSKQRTELKTFGSSFVPRWDAARGRR